MDLQRKIIWTTFFNNLFDFSKAYNELMRALIIIDMVLLVFSYIHSFEMHTFVYNKLLRALITSEWSDLILNEKSD